MSGPVNATIAGITWRALVGRRRALLLLALPVVLLGLAVALRLTGVAGVATSRAVLSAFALGTLVPLLGLIIGTGVIAPEIDDGSIVYLLAKPVPRPVIVVSKTVVAVGCVLVFGVLPVALTGLLLNPSEPALGVGYGLGALLAGVTYSALFVMLAAVTRHAVVFGLVYVLLWEGLLGPLLPGIRWFSVTQWGSAVAEKVSQDFGLDTQLGLTYALAAAAVVTVAAAWFAGSRLRSFRLTGEE